MEQFFKNKKSGFSLMELMITLSVLVVIGVVTTMVLKGAFGTEKTLSMASAVFKNDLETSLAAMNLSKGVNTFADTNDLINGLNDFYPIEINASKGDFADSYTDAKGKNIDLPTYDKYYQTKSNAVVGLSLVNDGSSAGQKVSSSDVLDYVTGMYDLNGKKGPNELGKDLWVLSNNYVLGEGEYLTIKDGEVCVNSQDGQSRVLVDKEGKFQETNSGVPANANLGENYGYDSYGNVVCLLSNHTCPHGFDQKTCKCLANTSCPTNQIYDKAEGKCICDPKIFPADDTRHHHGTANTTQCVWMCDPGAAETCTANGGVWNSVDCTCNCDTDAVKEKLAKGNGFAVALEEELCAAKCSQALFNEQMTSLTGGAKIKNGDTYRDLTTEEVENLKKYTTYNNDLTNGCYYCNSNNITNLKLVGSTYEIKLKDNKGTINIGLCTGSCSDDASADKTKNTVVTHEGNSYNYYKLPEKDSIAPSTCEPECTLTVDACKALYDKALNEYKGDKTWTTKNNTDCPINEDVFKCVDMNGKCGSTIVNKNAIKVDKTQCLCDFRGLQTAPTSSIDYEYAFHHYYCGCSTKSCGHRFVCEATPTVAFTINENNPKGNTATHKIINHVGESCKEYGDPIVLIMNDFGSNTYNAISKSVIVPYLNDENQKMKWLYSDKSNNYYFLTKTKKSAGDTFAFIADLFTDKNKIDACETEGGCTYPTGLNELRALYDTNNDKLINQLDDNYKALGLWADNNSNAKMDKDDDFATLPEKNVVEISTNIFYISTEKGGVLSSGDGSLQYSLQGNFQVGKPIESAPAGMALQRVYESYVDDVNTSWILKVNENNQCVYKFTENWTYDNNNNLKNASTYNLIGTITDGTFAPSSNATDKCNASLGVGTTRYYYTDASGNIVKEATDADGNPNKVFKENTLRLADFFFTFIYDND